MHDAQANAVEAHLTALLPEALTFLRELVEINSFTGNPEGVRANARRIEKQFAPFGFQSTHIPAELSDSGDHLLLDSGGNGPLVLMVAHLDTVYSAEEQTAYGTEWIENGDTINGPGTIDIKGGTAMLWMVLHAIKTLDPVMFANTRWLLAWNATEERLTADFAKACVQAIGTSRGCCLVFEGDNSTKEHFEILGSRGGLARYHITVRGRGAHSGNGHKHGANAVAQMARVITEITALTDYAQDLTVNVGIAQGGNATNRVPDFAEAWFEVRYATPAPYEALKTSLQSLCGDGDVRAVSDGTPCTIAIELDEEIPPWQCKPATEALVALWKSAAHRCGHTLSIGTRKGLSDANHLAAHIPTLDGLGPCGGNAHGLERTGTQTRITEFIDPSSLVPKAQINVFALLTTLSAQSAISDGHGS